MKSNHANKIVSNHDLNQPIRRQPVFYKPSNLDLRKIIRDSRLSPEDKAHWLKHLWKPLYIIYVVYIGRWNRDFEPYDYTPVSSKLLEDILGSNYATDAKRLLTKLGILECDGSYQAGTQGKEGSCLGYRFVEPYFSADFHAVDDIDYSEVNEVLWTREYKKKKDYPEMDFIEQNLSKIKIDDGVDEVLRKFKAECKREIDLFKKELNKLRKFSTAVDVDAVCDNALDEFKARMKFKIDFYKNSVDRIRRGDLECIDDPKTGRIFNVTTSLPRILRPYLMFEGSYLVELDCANAQPLFLISLYGDESERESFKKLVESGKFYETLDEELGKLYGLEKRYGLNRRDELKRAVYVQLLFGRVYPGPICKIFAEKFPYLWIKILELKKGEYRKLSQHLQTTEADVMIKGVIKQIMQTSPFFVLSLHDGILLESKNVEKAKAIMIDVFQKKLGVTPCIKIKNCTPPGSEANKVKNSTTTTVDDSYSIQTNNSDAKPNSSKPTLTDEQIQKERDYRSRLFLKRLKWGNLSSEEENILNSPPTWLNN